MGGIQLTDTALTILNARYLNRNQFGEIIETPEEMFMRVAREVAKEEVDQDLWVEKFYNVMSNLEFLPNSPVLKHAGLTQGTYFACFYIDIFDSRESIFDVLKEAVIINAMGGGIGFNFSNIRPKGDLIKSTGGIASGPISFAKIYDLTLGEVIAQGGFRYGAQMGLLSINHPDIEEFISCKREEGVLKSFNLSIAMTNDFMNKVIMGKPFEHKLTFNGVNYKTVDGLELWNKIIESAWRNGEPGLFFIDVVNEKNLLRDYEYINGCNPCGEQPLTSYGSCVLGSINLSKHVNKNGFDFDKLTNTVHTAVRFLDNLIDINNYPIKQIELETKKFRKIGLGVMGWADALIKLGIHYASDEARDIAKNVMKFISEHSVISSEIIGESKGTTIFNRRNGLLTTIAPTGSLSLIAGCSGGIEPVFSFKYKKNCVNRTIEIMHPLVEEYINKHNCSFDDLPEYFVEARNIPFKDHILMQAAFQEYTHNAISKTINMPNNSSIGDVSEAFKLAFISGCKGITVYRDGSREEEAQSVVTHEINQPQKLEWNSRPSMLVGITHKVKTGDGTVYLTLNHFMSDEQTNQIKKTLSKHPIMEVFAAVGKSGRSMQAMAEWATRGYSLALQKGATVKEVEKQSRGIFGENVSWSGGTMIRSIPDAFSKVLRSEYSIFFEDNKKQEQDMTVELCPDCGNALDFAEGCRGGKCTFCGFSKC